MLTGKALSRLEPEQLIKRSQSSPANIYLFKVAIETLEQGVKYVQSLQ